MPRWKRAVEETRDSSLIPPSNKDLATVTLSGNGVGTVGLTGLGFVPTILQVRADGDFQWATEADPVQGTGPWLDAGQLWNIPVADAVDVRFITHTSGATVHIYAKALGSV